MKEKELDEIVKLRDEYKMASDFLKQWHDYLYDENRIKYSDDYYDIKIEKDFNNETKLTIHLPTIIMAMEKHVNELHMKYMKKLSKI